MVRRLLLACAVMLFYGCASTPVEKDPLSAGAAMKDKDGKDVGVATLIQTEEGLRIAVTGYRLPPGTHGIHSRGRRMPAA